MASQIYTATGQIIDRDSSQGVPGLLVQAHDSSEQNNQVLLGTTKTDENGRFSISFNLQQFHFDTAPDLFFKVFREDKLLESTESSVLWNANTQESVTIRVRTTRQRDAGKDLVTFDQVLNGVEFIQKSDFKGVFNEKTDKVNTTLKFVKDMFVNSFSKMELKPVKVSGSRHNEVINQDVEVARQNLASKNVRVKEVVPYKPGLDTDSVKSISVVPKDLKAGEEIKLYEENGKVKYYSIIKPAAITSPGDVTKRFEEHKKELDKLDKELKVNNENAIKKDELINSLKTELEDLRKEHKDFTSKKDEHVISLERELERLRVENKETSSKKDDQIGSLHQELERVRKDHAEINTLLKSDELSRLLKDVRKNVKPAAVKKTGRKPNKPK